MSSARGRSKTRPRIAVTTGEPAGIGPDISIAAAAKLSARGNLELVLIGDRALLTSRAKALGQPLPAEGALQSIELPVPCTAGQPDPRNASYVLQTLDTAIKGCLAGDFDAMVTAPVQKSAINDAGVPFTGHTEYLAQQSQTPRVVMMLAGATSNGPLRVALATTHLKLADVPAAIETRALRETLAILDRDLRQRFGLDRPRIAVTGLNPHAGEGGHLGREEIEIIAPAVMQSKADGLDVDGPFPADTLFVPDIAQRFDVILAMYHDQGLPVLKYATFGHGVNVTLGLPFIRTSVDHGTALDLAGTGRADLGSLVAAIELAAELASRRA